MSNNVDFHWKTFNALNSWVAQADNKAIALLSADGVIAGIVAVHLDKIMPALQPHSWLVVISIVGLMFLLLSFFFAIRCVLPSISAGASTSITYFHHIAQLSEADYEARLQAALAVPHGPEKELIYQIWANSKVASRKYRCIFLSILSLTTALLLLLITGLLFYILYS